MIKGAYYEFIAFPCSVNGRYSMPLGVVFDEKKQFTVYKDAGFLRFLGKEGVLLLLSPSDPLLFVKSVAHALELEVRWDEASGCPELKGLGGVYRCHYHQLSDGGNSVAYSCNLEEVEPPQVPYTRAYGCLVELLVLLTKARAGVYEGWYLEYARGLKWCVEHSTRGSPEYVNTANAILQELESIVSPGAGGRGGLQGGGTEGARLPRGQGAHVSDAL